MKGAAVAAASFTTETACTAAPVPASAGERTVQDIASDEAFWRPIVAQYDVTPDVVNFENGYWGLMAKPVLEAFVRNTEKVNRHNSWYARRDYYSDIQPIHAKHRISPSARVSREKNCESQAQIVHRTGFVL